MALFGQQLAFGSETEKHVEEGRAYAVNVQHSPETRVVDPKRCQGRRP